MKYKKGDVLRVNPVFCVKHDQALSCLRLKIISFDGFTGTFRAEVIKRHNLKLVGEIFDYSQSYLQTGWFILDKNETDIKIEDCM